MCSCSEKDLYFLLKNILHALDHGGLPKNNLQLFQLKYQGTEKYNIEQLLFGKMLPLF